MWARFGDLDHTLALMDEVRRRMDRVWDDYEPGWPAGRPRRSIRAALASATWPRVNLLDAGSSVVLKADVPGMTEKDVQVNLDDGALTISGERRADAPAGYTAVRQERAGVKFSRSISLPCKVNPELASADLKDGVLTITLTKALEAQPRQISVVAK